MKTEYRFRVEWGDTDAAAIAFYPNFFRWFDEATWRLLHHVGLALDVLQREHELLGCPIVAAQAQFFKPVRFWDELSLTSFVSEWGAKSFNVRHEMRKDEKLCAVGDEKRVAARCVDKMKVTIEAVPIPPRFRYLLSGAS